MSVSTMQLMATSILVACATGCANASPIGSGVCPEPYIGAMSDDSIAVDGLSAVADFDCDGTPDRVHVSWVDDEGRQVPGIQLAGVAGRPSVLHVPVEGLPRIVALADLNGDSIRDIVVAVVDESTVLPQIVLVRPYGAALAHLSDGLEWSALQFRHDDQAPEGCAERMLPRVTATPGRDAYIEIYTGESWSAGCESPVVVRVAVEGDRVRPVH